MSSHHKTLAASMPSELTRGEYHDTRAYSLRDEPVIAEYTLQRDATWKPWPGRHKNVMAWVVLQNGLAVGFNENVATGWSFPVMRYKET